MTTLTFTRTIDAPVSEVYRAFSDRDMFRYWLCDEAQMNVASGGYILFTWYTGYYAFGVFKTFEENQKVVFSWRGAGETEDATITATFDALGDSQTRLTLTREGTVAEGAQAAIEREWNRLLDNLKSVLETGADLRMTNRVIIGIYPSNIDEATMKRLNLPSQDGTLVGGLVPGFSAEAAGIQTDDVILSINGQKVTQNNQIGGLVEGRKPGDEVAVTFYRDGQEHHITATLKGYPMPEFSADTAALADWVDTHYAGVIEELHTILDSVPEADAARPPAEGEWSAQEVLAHLILNERWLHTFLGGALQAPEGSGYSCNTPARIKGLLAAYPTTAELLEELRRAYTETAAILRYADLGRRQFVFWWWNFEVKSLEAHTRTHLEQIRAAVQVATPA